ncbi:unnamed protein product, partial [Mesorhabditis spiculigera]
MKKVERCLDSLKPGVYITHWKEHGKHSKIGHTELRKRGAASDHIFGPITLTEICLGILASVATFGDFMQHYGDLLQQEPRVRMVPWNAQEVGAYHPQQSGYYVVRNFLEWYGLGGSYGVYAGNNPT